MYSGITVGFSRILENDDGVDLMRQLKINSIRELTQLKTHVEFSFMAISVSVQRYYGGFLPNIRE